MDMRRLVSVLVAVGGVALALSVLHVRKSALPPLVIKPSLLWERKVAPVMSMPYAAFSSDGRYLATVSDGRELRLLNPRTGVQVKAVRAPQGSYWELTFSPDGKLVATGGNASALYDLDTERLQRRLEPATASPLSFSPDGRLLAGAGRETVVWDTCTGRIVRRLGRTNDLQADATFSPDGSVLVYAEHVMVNGERIEQTNVWDTRRHRISQTIHGVLRSYAFSPDGQVLAAHAIGAPVVRMWNVTTGKRLRPFVDWRKVGGPCAVAFSPDGKLIAVAGTALPWIPKSPFPWSRPQAIPNRAVGGVVTLCDARTAQILWQQKVSHVGRVLSVDFSPDGKLLAAGVAWDAKVMVWRIR